MGSLTAVLRTTSSSQSLDSLNLNFGGFLPVGWALVSDMGYSTKIVTRVGGAFGLTVKQQNVWWTGANCTGSSHGFPDELSPGEMIADGQGTLRYINAGATLSSVNIVSYRQSSGGCQALPFTADGYPYTTNNVGTTGFSLNSSLNYWVAFQP